MNDGEGQIRCPLCGHMFLKSKTACRPGCPFGKGCALTCCPRCHYRFPEESKIVGVVRKFWSGRRGKEKI